MKTKYTNNVHTDAMLRQMKEGKGLKVTFSAFDCFVILPIIGLGLIVLVILFG